jgi:hypothetical protein
MMGVPFLLSDLLSELKLTGNAGPVIKQFDLFERVEKAEGGYLCKWVKPSPNEKLFEDVANAIREYTREATRTKQKSEAPISEKASTNSENGNGQINFPDLPPNMPGPLQAVCNLIMDSMKQQNTYLKAMGVAVADMQLKVDNLHSQLNS